MGIPGRIALLVSTLIFSISGNAKPLNYVEKAPEAHPGQFLARVKTPGALKALDHRILEVVINGKVLRAHNDLNLVVIAKPSIQNRESSIEDIMSSGQFDVVEPNYIYRAKNLPNDPDLGKLWGLKNIGQADTDKQVGVSGIDIDMERAWKIATDSSSIITAIIDTGMDINHNDLKANLWVNTAELNGQPNVDDDNNGVTDDIHGASFVDPASPSGNNRDDHGHGSHCAGSIGANGDDGTGIVGVGWKAQLMGVKFLGADGSGSLEGAIKSIEYANKMGAKILSNSWGGGGFSQILKDMIDNTNKSGALFVAAAANDGSNNDDQPVYPASYDVPNIISVAALDNRGNLASFSNYGKKTVHIAAPGVNILSSVRGGSYDTWSGTSMATPHVSGVAALVWAQEPGLSNLELKERILKSARPLASMRNKVSTGGLLNAYYALTQEVPPEDPNDPAKWAQQSAQGSTPHPYKSKQIYEAVVEVAGATQMAIYFDRFETESGYDLVTFTDRSGKVLGTMSGKQDASYSPVFESDYVKLTLKTDDSVDKYGFDISAVAYK